MVTESYSPDEAEKPLAFPSRPLEDELASDLGVSHAIAMEGDLLLPVQSSMSRNGFLTTTPS